MSLIKSGNLVGGVIIPDAYWIIEAPVPQKLAKRMVFSMAGFTSAATRAAYQAALDNYLEKYLAAGEATAAREALKPAPGDSPEIIQQKTAATGAAQAAENIAHAAFRSADQALKNPDIRPFSMLDTEVPPEVFDDLMTDGAFDPAKAYAWLKTTPTWIGATDG